MNGFCLVVAYQIANIMERGVAEWDSGTTYYKGAIVNTSGILYVSIADSNLNNAVTVQSKWSVYGTGITTVSSVYTILSTDQYVRCDTTSATFIATLPAAASTALGAKYVVKNVGSGGNALTLKGNASELIDGANTQTLNSTPTLDSMTVINNGTGWDIV
jgi:hypothetical protein